MVTRSDALPAEAAAVARAWLGDGPLRYEPLRGGGFSGAPVVLVRPESAPACVLKRVARDAATAPHARWVHALVTRARQRGVAELPAPLVARSGATLVAGASGGLWELVPLVFGSRVERPALRHLEAAMRVLARLHAAWSDDAATSGDGSEVVPPAALRRIRQAAALVAHPWATRRRTAAPPHGQAGDGLIDAVLALWDRAIAIFAAHGGAQTLTRIAGARPPALRLQPVARDIWYDHVLFASSAAPRVAAVVDLHGAGVDTPATDIARLAGSWWSNSAGSRWEAWLAQAVEAYAGSRPLGADERALVPWLHAAGVVCALDNWFGWIVEQRRDFPDSGRVLDRIGRLLDALPPALEWLTEHPLDRV